MPEAVIVSTARSPIGRAFKGSLKDVRPDDLAAAVVTAALEKIPALDPTMVDDLYLGCAEPWGEHGSNMARVVAVLAGYDHLPGATINRFCASSVQTTRMAFHAIRAGEGDVFISAGVEAVSRYVDFAGAGGSKADWQNPRFAEATARSARTAAENTSWTDPREDGRLPDIYLAMGQTAENVAGLRGERSGGRPASRPPGLWGLRLLSEGRRLGLPRTARPRLEGSDSEFHQVIAGEPEAPPQVGRRPAAQGLTLLLELLAAMDEVLQLAPRGLLLTVQALALGDQRVERRDDLLEVRHLRQVRLDVGVDQLPLRDLLRERLCFTHGFSSLDQG